MHYPNSIPSFLFAGTCEAADDDKPQLTVRIRTLQTDFSEWFLSEFGKCLLMTGIGRPQEPRIQDRTSQHQLLLILSCVGKHRVCVQLRNRRPANFDFCISKLSFQVDYGECGFPGFYSYRCGFPCSRDAPLSYREAVLYGHSRNFLDGKIPPSQVHHAFSL
jgi:hypothetical protein